jgi:hypothetical protein
MVDITKTYIKHKYQSCVQVRMRMRRVRVMCMHGCAQVRAHVVCDCLRLCVWILFAFIGSTDATVPSLMLSTKTSSLYNHTLTQTHKHIYMRTNTLVISHNVHTIFTHLQTSTPEHNREAPIYITPTPSESTGDVEKVEYCELSIMNVHTAAIVPSSCTVVGSKHDICLLSL